MFALVNSKAKLFFKVGDKNHQDFTNAGSSQHGKMPYFEVPEEVAGNNSLLQKWAQTAIESASETKTEPITRSDFITLVYSIFTFPDLTISNCIFISLD